MPNDQIRFWIESFASLIGIVGILAIVWELDRARKADAREFLFYTYAQFNKIHKQRVVVENLEINSLDEFLLTLKDPDSRESILAFFNFMDMLTRTVRDKSINSKIAVEHFGRIFMDYYEKTVEYQHQYRELEGNSTWFESFDWFAEEYRRHMPGDYEAYQRGQAYVADLFARTD